MIWIFTNAYRPSRMPTSNAPAFWPESYGGATSDVPERYLGVWSRTLLETPQKNDHTTFVRWMQLGRWHVDLRIPADAADSVQGFSGITQVQVSDEGEICTWHRLVDFQPPRPTVDEGCMVFEGPDRVIETGIHGVYREVWERLPESAGRRIVLSEPAREDGLPDARLFVSGNCLMRVRPSSPLGAAFEISFGSYKDDLWQVEQSTLRRLVGQAIPLSIDRQGPDNAIVDDGESRRSWRILE